MIFLELHKKEVRFDKYCKTCKHQYESDGADPCNDCLEHPARLGSVKPIHYEEEIKNKRPFRRKTMGYNRNK